MESPLRITGAVGPRALTQTAPVHGRVQEREDGGAFRESLRRQEQSKRDARDEQPAEDSSEPGTAPLDAIELGEVVLLARGLARDALVGSGAPDLDPEDIPPGSQLDLDA